MHVVQVGLPRVSRPIFYADMLPWQTLGPCVVAKDNCNIGYGEGSIRNEPGSYIDTHNMAPIQVAKTSGFNQISIMAIHDIDSQRNLTNRSIDRADRDR